MKSNVATDLIWIQTSFIGDIILTTAAFGLARRLFPNARQHLVTTGAGAAALGGHAELHSVTVFRKSGANVLPSFRALHAALVPQLGRQGPALILQPHKSFRSSFLARYLRSRIGAHVYTYDEAAAGFLADHRVPRVAVLHEAARIGLLLEPFGATRDEIVAARPKLDPLPLEDDGAWQTQLDALAGKQLIGIAPGSIWGTKRWPKERFAELVRLLLSDEAVFIVTLGSDKEAELARDILAASGAGERAIDLCGKTSLKDLRRVFPKLSLVVSNDSSPVHFASAFDVPTVAVFGATVVEMGFGPLAQRSTSVGIDLSCRPCSDHGPEVCPLGHFKCMRDLSARTVHEACRRLLAKTH